MVVSTDWKPHGARWQLKCSAFLQLGRVKLRCAANAFASARAFGSQSVIGVKYDVAWAG